MNASRLLLLPRSLGRFSVTVSVRHPRSSSRSLMTQHRKRGAPPGAAPAHPPETGGLCRGATPHAQA